MMTFLRNSTPRYRIPGFPVPLVSPPLESDTRPFFLLPAHVNPLPPSLTGCSRALVFPLTGFFWKSFFDLVGFFLPSSPGKVYFGNFLDYIALSFQPLSFSPGSLSGGIGFWWTSLPLPSHHYLFPTPFKIERHKSYASWRGGSPLVLFCTFSPSVSPRLIGCPRFCFCTFCSDSPSPCASQKFPCCARKVPSPTLPDVEIVAR